MDKSELLLSPDRASELTAALSSSASANGTPGVADPLQTCCDEATAEVQRMTMGYVLDALSLQKFTRSLALFAIYSAAGPVPLDIQKEYERTSKEMAAIASGNRPNLPKSTVTPPTPNNGAWGSGRRIRGRM